MSLKQFIPILVLFALACGTLPAPVKFPLPSHSAAPAPSMYAVRMVSTGKLHIRVEPGNLQSCSEPCYLQPGDVVICYEFRTIGDSVWCHHGGGWSNVRWLEAK